MYLKRLKFLRMNAGLKQTEIADLLGIQQTVYLVVSEVFKLYRYTFNKTSRLLQYFN